MNEIGMMEEDVQVSTPYEIEETKFSSLTKLLRLPAWCTRFINNLRGSSMQGCLSEDEITSSMKMWVKHIQEMHLLDGTVATTKNKWNSVR